MRKRSHSRNDIQADNKGSGKNPHLSDEQILLALDGELSSREAAKVNMHLEACWSCRARSQQIESAIADIVEYRDSLIRPYFPVPPGGLEEFSTRLQKLARTVGHSPLKSRIIGPLRVMQAFLQDLVPRHAWISALVLASFVILLFTRLWQAPRVSASQLLENSRAFEVRQLGSVAKPIVFQKLHIRIGTKAVTRTIYRDSVRMRQVDHVDASGDAPPNQTLNHSGEIGHAAESELRGTFLALHMNWQDPLSAASYSSWRDSLPAGGQDEVTTADNRRFLILKTTPSQGAISEARITFRAADFHPVEEEVRLQDAREVEIREMAWDVLPMEAVNPAIFSQEQEEVRHAESQRPVSLFTPAQGPSDSQLAEAELQARVAMHVAGADLGEPIELGRSTAGSNQRSVIVRGIVSSLGRENDLLAAFRGIPHLEFRLQTLEEAKAQENPHGTEVQDPNQRTAPDGPPEVPTRVTVVNQPVFESQLEKSYPRPEDRIAFVNRVVELAQDALAEAWALRRLSDRYDADAVAELSLGSRQTLELLIRDHVSLLRQHVNTAQDLIAPFLPGPRSAPDQPESAFPEIGDWRDSVAAAFTGTQRICDSVVVLFAGSRAAEPETAAPVADDLQRALARLQVQLRALYENISEPIVPMQRSASPNLR